VRGAARDVAGAERAGEEIRVVRLDDRDTRRVVAVRNRTAGARNCRSLARAPLRGLQNVLTSLCAGCEQGAERRHRELTGMHWMRSLNEVVCRPRGTPSLRAVG